MPFDDSNIRKMVRRQYAKQLDFPRKKPISNECKDLILNILDADVHKRATIKEIRAHVWLKMFANGRQSLHQGQHSAPSNFLQAVGDSESQSNILVRKIFKVFILLLTYTRIWPNKNNFTTSKHYDNNKFNRSA